MPSPQMPISKLNDRIGERILVNSYKHITGKFGGQYLCKTDAGTSFFSNKSIYDFIQKREQHREETGPFYISPLEERSFQNSDNNTITYTVVACSEIN